MGISVLNELHGEIKRVMAAGSTIVCGDFGMKKLIPSIKKLGQSAPVFAKLAVKVEDLTEGNENSEEKLLELLSIVNAILYTQGNWEIKGDLKPLELIENNCTTNLSYRKLKSIIEALTSRGGGRYSVIFDSYNEGVFNKKDRRLIFPILKAIEDPYIDISELVIENIIPLYGDVLLPILKTDFNIGGGKFEGRKLKAIYKISGKDDMELYKKAAEEGSTEVVLSSIEILNKEKAPESIFEELLKHKKKEIRAEAEAVLKERKRFNLIFNNPASKKQS